MYLNSNVQYKKTICHIEIRAIVLNLLAFQSICTLIAIFAPLEQFHSKLTLPSIWKVTLGAH